MWKTLGGVFALAALAACGSTSSPAKGTTPATTAGSTTTTVPATTAVATTRPATTTTVEHVSRDTVLAATRCVEAATAFGLGTLAVLNDDASRLQAAEALCKEALTQLEVDSPGSNPTSRINKVSASIAGQNLAMSLLVVKIAGGTAVDQDGHKYDTGALVWKDAVNTLLGGLKT